MSSRRDTASTPTTISRSDRRAKHTTPADIGGCHRRNDLNFQISKGAVDALFLIAKASVKRPWASDVFFRVTYEYVLMMAAAGGGEYAVFASLPWVSEGDACGLYRASRHQFDRRARLHDVAFSGQTGVVQPDKIDALSPEGGFFDYFLHNHLLPLESKTIVPDVGIYGYHDSKIAAKVNGAVSGLAGGRGDVFNFRYNGVHYAFCPADRRVIGLFAGMRGPTCAPLFEGLVF